MPYIAQKDRLFLDSPLDYLVETIQELDGEPVASAGVINYVITNVVVRTMRPEAGWSYSSLSKALAVFRDAEMEMRRRILDPYEDKAIAKNGDIPEYEPLS
jgi:hypothetical protein